jgi:preprotein translocase subunit SecD
MKKKTSIIALSIIVLVTAIFTYLAVAGMQIGVYDWLPMSKAVKQGLDLRGGMYITYRAKNPEIEFFNEKMETAHQVLRNRLDAQGYTEATIARQNDTIRIEIPDVDDPNVVAGILGKPAKLEFIGPDDAVIMEGSEIKRAIPNVPQGEGNKWVVSFELNDEAAAKFAQATTKFQGQIIRIVLDGKVIQDPRVNGVIPNGRGQIEGMANESEARTLAMQIESGALPIELEQLEMRSISATLGENALKTSLLAGVIGIIALFIFLIVFYRLSGFISSIALTIYLLIVVYVIALFGVQLTLPGFAGIILGVGMAVDANVIIFERIKEELRLGKTLRTSVESGFKKAFVTIIDANVTTLIIAFVLMWFGTGAIKGFAYTLAIGIVVSVFTAIVITKYLLRCMIALNIKNPKLYISNYKVKEEAK